MKNNGKGFTQVLIVILLLVLVIVGGGAYYFGSQKSSSDLDLESKISVDQEYKETNLPSPTPDQAEKLEVFKGSNFIYSNNVYTGYEFKFPQSCVQSISSLNCKLAHGNATIMVNAGGHGGENIETKVIKSNETMVIPAGEGKLSLIEDVKAKTVFGTFWINKTDILSQEPIFGFEFSKIPVDDLAEFEKLFDQMMKTFSFID